VDYVASLSESGFFCAAEEAIDLMQIEVFIYTSICVYAVP